MDGAFTPRSEVNPRGARADAPPPAPAICNQTSKEPLGLSVKSRSQQFCTLSGAHPSGLRGFADAAAAAAAAFLFVFSQVLLRGSPEISVLNCFLVQKATQMHLELVMDFASVKASDAVLIVPTGYS